MRERIAHMMNSFKNLNAKNKNILFALIGIVILIPLSLWLLSADENEKISENFQNSLKENTEVKEQGFVPPKLDNPFTTNENNSSKDTNNTQIKEEQKTQDKKENLASFAKDKNELETQANLKELPNANLDQEEAIRQIAKTQKPKDMIEFLKGIQKDIQILANKNLFKYDLKEYKVGDKFLDWFEIELITKNLIRFKDKNYAYNLRFLGD